MTDFVLATADPKTMLSHMALYGLAAIVEDAGLEDVRLSWTLGMESRPVLSAPHATPETIGELVRAHAAHRATPESWPNRPVTDGKRPALMSPRITVIPTLEGWRSLQKRRHDVLDRLTDARAMLDLRLIAALGEPSYWSFWKGERRQDDGASRLEMQPRQQGSEFVGTRIRPLAAAIAARTAAAITNGLLGLSVRDEIATPAKLTATGFASPGPTDNALAWCALWGISQFPVAQRTSAAASKSFAVTTGHFGRSTGGYFYLPVWAGQWRTGRLRTIIGSGQLCRYATKGLVMEDGEPADVTAAGQWLANRGVTSVVRFAVQWFGSKNAPERRAMLGEFVKTGRQS